MKNKKEKLSLIKVPLSCLLSFTLAFGMLPANAFALDGADDAALANDAPDSEGVASTVDEEADSDLVGSEAPLDESDSDVSVLALEDDVEAIEDGSVSDQALVLASPYGGSFMYGSEDLEWWKADLSYAYYLYDEIGDSWDWAVSIDSSTLYFDVDSEGNVYADFDYGTHEVTFTPKAGYQWEDGTDASKTVTLTIKGLTASSPKGGVFVGVDSPKLEEWRQGLDSQYRTSADGGASWDWSVYVDSPTLDFYRDGGEMCVDFVPGTHEVTFSLAEGYQWEDGTVDPKTVTLVVNEAVLASPKGGVFVGVDSPKLEEWRQGLASQYRTSADGGASWDWSVYVDSPTLDFYRDGGEMCVDFVPGTHEVTFSLAEGYQWEDGTVDPKSVSLRIIVAPVSVPQGGSFLYDSDELWNWKHSVVADYASKCDISSQTCDIHSSSETIPVGSHKVAFDLKDGFKWSDGTTGRKTVDLVVYENAPEEVEAPEGGSFLLGSEELDAWLAKALGGVGFGASCKDLDLANPSEWKPGTYEVAFDLEEGCQWNDGSVGQKTVKIELLQAVSVPQGGSFLIGSDDLASWCASYLDEIEATASCYTLALANPDSWKPGTHKVKFFLGQGCRWADGSTGSKTVTLTLTGSQAVPKGGSFLLNSDDLDAWRDANIKGANATPVCHTLNLAFPGAWTVGVHTVEYILDEGYCWADGSTGTKSVTLNLSESIPVPEDGLFAKGSRDLNKWVEENLNGERVTATCSSLDLSDPSSWDSGEYVITLTPKSGYVWADGSTSSKKATVRIEGFVSFPQGASFAMGSADLDAWYKENIEKSGATATCRTLALDDPASWKPGRHTIKYFLDFGMLWEDDSSLPKTIELILLATVKSPVGGTFAPQSEELSDWCERNLNMDHVSVSCGTLALSDPESWKTGSHAVKFVLDEGYQWEDGTVEPKTVTLTLAGLDIAETNPQLSYSSKAYTGSQLKPSVSFETEGMVLNSDYTVSYANNVNAGTATVTIAGKGEYIGSVQRTFTITPASLTGSTVTLSKTYYTANGTYRKPVPTVVASGRTLSATEDYSVAYSNNKAVGFGKVTITGKGNYKGTLTAKFTILPANQGWNQVGSYWYYRDGTKLVTGWKTISNVKYYFGASTGKMLTGLQLISGKRYYFDSSGAMKKNAWQQVGSYWYYLTSTGAAKSGWLSDGGVWYYFDPANNRMLANTTRVIDGVSYRFGSSGAML